MLAVPTAAQYTAGIWDGLQTTLPNLPPGGGRPGDRFPAHKWNAHQPACPPYTISFTISVTDQTTGQTISRPYNISVTAPTAPVLPTPSLAAGTVNQGYTGTITATGGVGPNYTWTINGTPLATNGSAVSITDGLTVSNTGTNVLTIGGTPTSVSTSPGVQFTAQVKDNTTNLTSGAATTYTIVVNSAGSNVSGQVYPEQQLRQRGPPAITLNLLTNPGDGRPDADHRRQRKLYLHVDSERELDHLSVNHGAEFRFLTGNSERDGKQLHGSLQNFEVSLGYTFSGTVSYSGSNTGQVYLTLHNTTCGGETAETGRALPPREPSRFAACRLARTT